MVQAVKFNIWEYFSEAHPSVREFAALCSLELSRVFVGEYNIGNLDRLSEKYTSLPLTGAPCERWLEGAITILRAVRNRCVEEMLLGSVICMTCEVDDLVQLN